MGTLFVIAACNEGNATKNGPKSHVCQYRSYSENEGEKGGSPFQADRFISAREGLMVVGVLATLTA